MENYSEIPSTSGLQESGDIKRPKLTTDEINQDQQNDCKVVEEKPSSNNEMLGDDLYENVQSNGQRLTADDIEQPEEVNVIRFKSLAGLIGFCRDSGIQIFNDTHNVPEADRLRMEALGEQGNVKKHSSDEDPKRRKRSKQIKSGKTSTVPSEGSVWRATSRISSIYSSVSKLNNKHFTIKLNRIIVYCRWFCNRSIELFSELIPFRYCSFSANNYLVISW